MPPRLLSIACRRSRPPLHRRPRRRGDPHRRRRRRPRCPVHRPPSVPIPIIRISRPRPRPRHRHRHRRRDSSTSACTRPASHVDAARCAAISAPSTTLTIPPVCGAVVNARSATSAPRVGNGRTRTTPPRSSMSGTRTTMLSGTAASSCAPASLPPSPTSTVVTSARSRSPLASAMCAPIR